VGGNLHVICSHGNTESLTDEPILAGSSWPWCRCRRAGPVRRLARQASRQVSASAEVQHGIAVSYV
jgi:hypothetical protein